MQQNTSKQWSDRLRETTRQALRNGSVTPDGRIHMKQINGGFGWFDAIELSAATYALHLRDSDEILSFDDPDAIVAAGWAID